MMPNNWKTVCPRRCPNNWECAANPPRYLNKGEKVWKSTVGCLQYIKSAIFPSGKVLSVKKFVSLTKRKLM